MPLSRLEDKFRRILKGHWGLYLRGRISLDGDFSSDQLREIANLADEMGRNHVDLIEVERDFDFDDEDDDEE